MSLGVEKANKSVWHDSSEVEHELSLQTRNKEIILLQKQLNPSGIYDARIELCLL